MPARTSSSTYRDEPDFELATLKLLAAPTEHHRHLRQLIGDWTTEGRYFLPSGEATDITGTI
jgi:hypothetical protein